MSSSRNLFKVAIPEMNDALALLGPGHFFRMNGIAFHSLYSQQRTERITVCSRYAEHVESKGRIL